MTDWAARLTRGLGAILCAAVLVVLASAGGVQAHTGHGHHHGTEQQTAAPIVVHVDVSDAGTASATTDAAQPTLGQSYVTAAVEQVSAPCHTGCGPGGCLVTGHTGCCCTTGSATTVEQYETALLHTFIIAVRGFEMPALTGQAASPLDRPPKR